MNNKPNAMMREMIVNNSQQVSPMKSPGTISKLSTANNLKKEMSVWDAMTIADQERYRKEQQ